VGEGKVRWVRARAAARTTDGIAGFTGELGSDLIQQVQELETLLPGAGCQSSLERGAPWGQPKMQFTAGCWGQDLQAHRSHALSGPRQWITMLVLRPHRDRAPKAEAHGRPQAVPCNPVKVVHLDKAAGPEAHAVAACKPPAPPPGHQREAENTSGRKQAAPGMPATKASSRAPAAR
jgi:hypothetical protein